jgi:hypothetical protein
MHETEITPATNNNNIAHKNKLLFTWPESSDKLHNVGISTGGASTVRLSFYPPLHVTAFTSMTTMLR